MTARVVSVELTDETQAAVVAWVRSLGAHIDLHVSEVVQQDDLGLVATIRDRISGESITIGAGT